MFFKPHDTIENVRLYSFADFIHECADLRNKYLNQKDVYLLEIAGRDSLAAALKLASQTASRPLIFVPSIAYHPGLYGDFSVAMRNISFLRDKLQWEDTQIIFDSPFYMDLSDAFVATILRTMGKVQKNIGYFSPCPPCHLLMHLARIPYARFLGISNIITGERIKHGSREKINQLPETLDFYKIVVNEFDIKLVQPLHDITENADIETLIGPSWNDADNQYECIFTKNYLDDQNVAILSAEQVLSQLETFYSPTIKEILQNQLALFDRCAQK